MISLNSRHPDGTGCDADHDQLGSVAVDAGGRNIFLRGGAMAGTNFSTLTADECLLVDAALAISAESLRTSQAPWGC